MVDLPDRGPWCPRCQHEMGYDPKTTGTVEQLQRAKQRATSAYLAYKASLPVTCAGCAQEVTPVMRFDDKKPESESKAVESKAGTAKIPQDSQRIIESIFKIDLWPEWERLHHNIMLGDEHRNNRGMVKAALDRAENNRRVAHKLYANFRIDLERYKIDTEINQSAMRDEAFAKLQGEKQNKQRSKTITNDDVRAKMAELHPDAFRHARIEVKKFELAVEHAKDFHAAWVDRCYDLRVLLNSMSGGGD